MYLVAGWNACVYVTNITQLDYYDFCLLTAWKQQINSGTSREIYVLSSFQFC